MAIFVRNISTHTVEIELPGGNFLRLMPRETCKVKSTDCKSSVFRRLVQRSVLEEFTSEQVLELKKKQKNSIRKLQKRIAETKKDAEGKAKNAEEAKKKAEKEAKRKIKTVKGRTARTKKKAENKKTHTPTRRSTTASKSAPKARNIKLTGSDDNSLKSRVLVERPEANKDNQST